VCDDRDVRLHEMSIDTSTTRRGGRFGILRPVAIRYGTQCTLASSGKNRRCAGQRGENAIPRRDGLFLCFYITWRLFQERNVTFGGRAPKPLLTGPRKPCFGARSGKGAKRPCAIARRNPTVNIQRILHAILRSISSLRQDRRSIRPGDHHRRPPRESPAGRWRAGQPRHLNSIPASHSPTPRIAPQWPTADAPGTSHRGCTDGSTPCSLILHQWTDSYQGPIADPPSLKPAGRDATADRPRRSTSKRNAVAASDGNHSVGVRINVHGPTRPPRMRHLGVRANSSKY
jgi:hypothetical protein